MSMPAPASSPPPAGVLLFLVFFLLMVFTGIASSDDGPAGEHDGQPMRDGQPVATAMHEMARAVADSAGMCDMAEPSPDSTAQCDAPPIQAGTPEREPGLNLDGAPLALCSTDPLTGFWRDGYCETGPRDRGRHVVCAEVTREFLEYTATRGNDLVTPRPELRFPGLEPADRWCLCASRWEEARRAGVAPPVILAATHQAALRYVERAELEGYALE